MFFMLFDAAEGLPFDRWTLFLGSLSTVLWLASVLVIARLRRVGWSMVPTSIFGLTWLWFGTHYVIRFWILVVDMEHYGTSPVENAPIAVRHVNLTLSLILLFWGVVCIMYMVSARAPMKNPFVILAGFGEQSLTRLAFVLDLSIFAATIAIGVLGVDERGVPQTIQRPVGLVGSLWVVPATIAWGNYWLTKSSKRPFGVRRWLYLIPGVLYFILVPYRERLLLVVAIPFITRMLAGGRVRLRSFLILLLVVGVISTSATTMYRLVLHENYSVEDAVRSIDVNPRSDDPTRGVFLLLAQRFHSFDSLLLTSALVPDRVPFDSRNPFTDAITSAFVPRVLFPDKPQFTRARDFSSRIWQWGLETRIDSRIAPSMVGDLYSAGGIYWVFIGAILWGVLIGLLDGWKRRLSPMAQMMIVCYLGIVIMVGVEKDFATASATVLQFVLLLWVFGFIMKPGRKMGTTPHVAYDHDMQGLHQFRGARSRSQE